LATIYDRSRLIVSVPKRPALERRFAYSNTKGARAYLLELRAQGYEKAEVSTEQNNFLLRIRKKGGSQCKPMLETKSANPAPNRRCGETMMVG
jgi:hypothetical protein